MNSCLPSRVFAIDWSGDLRQARRKIWLAEAKTTDLLRIHNGRNGEEVASWLMEEAEKDCHFVVGLDFAFSFPAWFCHDLHMTTAYEVWTQAALRGEQWLRHCQVPFWGRPGRTLCREGEHFRRTELAIAGRHRGARPKSIFQVGGAGAVGTGSIRGMPILKRLHEAGFSIWPFDSPGWPRVIEIYPRLLTGRVNKSSPGNRAAYLNQAFPQLPRPYFSAAASSEDAFDAAVSALVMAGRADEFACLLQATDSCELLEGRIWY